MEGTPWPGWYPRSSPGILSEMKESAKHSRDLLSNWTPPASEWWWTDGTPVPNKTLSTIKGHLCTCFPLNLKTANAGINVLVNTWGAMARARPQTDNASPLPPKHKNCWCPWYMGTFGMHPWLLWMPESFPDTGMPVSHGSTPSLISKFWQKCSTLWDPRPVILHPSWTLWRDLSKTPGNFQVELESTPLGQMSLYDLT